MSIGVFTFDPYTLPTRSAGVESIPMIDTYMYFLVMDTIEARATSFVKADIIDIPSRGISALPINLILRPKKQI